MWDGSGVGKRVAGLFPNDADGNAWGYAELCLPKPLAAAGYALTDPGRYPPMSQDFSNMIGAYKAAGCEIVTGNMIPPDLRPFGHNAHYKAFLRR